MTRKKSNRRKQLWVDEEFVRKINEIKLKRMLINKEKLGTPQITKEMLETPSFKQLEQELLKKDMKAKLKIKLDGII